jgi:hypothetical protein
MNEDNFMEEFDEYSLPYYHTDNRGWDAARFIEALPAWNQIPSDYFSPDLIDDPSNFVQQFAEL